MLNGLGGGANEDGSEESGGSEKGQSLISAYWSSAITMNTPRFKKLSTALNSQVFIALGIYNFAYQLIWCSMASAEALVRMAVRT